MKTFRLSRKSYAIAAAIGVVGTCAGLYTHHWLASHAPARLSARRVAGTWKGTAFLQVGPLNAQHTLAVPAEATFGPNGKVVMRGGSGLAYRTMVAQMRSDYSVQGQSIVFSDVFDLRVNKRTYGSFARRASLTGSTLTIGDPSKPNLVLHRG